VFIPLSFLFLAQRMWGCKGLGASDGISHPGEMVPQRRV
jgi:hypothetical protein